MVSDRRDAAARLAARDDVRERHRARLLVRLLEAIGQVLGERSRRQKGVGDACAKGVEHTLCVTGRDWNGSRADSQKSEMRVPGDERPSAERAQDTAVLVDAGGVVGASAHHGPGLHVGPRQCQDVRGARGAAGLINTLDEVRFDTQIAAEGRVLIERRFELSLARERDVLQVAETDERRAEPCLAELSGIERRGLSEAAELALPGAGREPKGITWRGGLDLTLPDPVAITFVAREPVASGLHAGNMMRDTLH